MYNIIIVGAGAIGGLLGARLSALPHVSVTMVARGPHLAAILASGGLKLHPAPSPPPNTTPSSPPPSPIHATNASYVPTLAAAPQHNVHCIILAVKEHHIEPLLPSLLPLLASSPEAFLLTTQNGVPWWFFQRHPRAPPHLADTPIRAVDPHGALLRAIDPSRVVACVVYPAASILSPGVVVHHEGHRFPLGELDGTAPTPRTTALAEIFTAAGFKSPVLSDVRAELWLKLWGSAAFNPVSALTHATLAAMARDGSEVRRLVERVMAEVGAVGRAVGVGEMRVEMGRRIDGAARVGEHKTSMLQDVEAGRGMEIEALVGAVVEMAEATETDVPHLYALYACVRMLQKTMFEEGCAFPPRRLQ